MSGEIPMPSAPTEEAVARMLYDGAPKCVLYDWGHAKAHARAVLALCEAKVREACEFYADSDDFDAMDAEAIERIVARVMGKEATCPDGYGDRHAAKCENAVVAARVIEGAWGDGYIAGRRAALDAPLAAPSGGDATPRDEAVEPVAWAVVRANGTRDCVYQQEESAAASVARLNAETDEGFIVANQPYRVVALVPQKGGAR